MAQFCNPEKEGQQGHQEVEKVPSGFGAPRRVSVASHGVLYSGWQPNPERTVMSAPWFRVECCTRWPAHNESYINGLCGHRIHEGCILTLQQPYRMEACPVCCSHTTHFEREGLLLHFITYWLCYRATIVQVPADLPLLNHFRLDGPNFIQLLATNTDFHSLY